MHTHIIPGLHIHTRHFLLVIDNCARRCRQGACFHRWQGAFLLTARVLSSSTVTLCNCLLSSVTYLAVSSTSLSTTRRPAFAAISSCSCSLLLAMLVRVRLRSSTFVKPFFCPFGISLPMLAKRESHLNLHASPASVHAEDSHLCLRMRVFRGRG